MAKGAMETVGFYLLARWCEPISRLNSVDLVLVNGEDFNVQPSVLINAKTGQEQSLASLAQQEVVAVAGIGKPRAFLQPWLI